MTVDDKHTCSSPFVIKLGAICVAVDVVVDKFKFVVIFFFGMSTTNLGVENSVKDFSVASKVTSGIGYRHTDPISICLECQSAFRCLFLDPVVDRYDIVDFVKCVGW